MSSRFFNSTNLNFSDNLDFNFDIINAGGSSFSYQNILLVIVVLSNKFAEAFITFECNAPGVEWIDCRNSAKERGCHFVPSILLYLLSQASNSVVIPGSLADYFLLKSISFLL